MTSYVKDINKIIFTQIKDIILALGLTYLCINIIACPNYSSSGISKGINFCANILIPSLFPFMVISAFIVKSGISLKIEKLMLPITKYIFNLPGCTGATIILSLIGGFPVGARGIKNLYDNKMITLEQARRMMMFCVGAGPAFVISVVGNNLLKNKDLGIIIFISQVIASILLGIILGIYSRVKHIDVQKYKKSKNKSIVISEAFTYSCLDSTQAIINMCSFVILFSSLIEIINNLGLNSYLAELLSKLNIPSNISETLIPIILEVTNGCIESVNNNIPLPLLSFAIGWAGVCVHFQILSSIDNINISYVKFTLFRLLHGAIAMAITLFSIQFIDATKTTFSNIQVAPCASISSSLLGSILLLITCIVFVINTLFQYIPSSNSKSYRNKA